jgi:ribosomal protein S18 acetylase RimI-like enzyme
MTTEKLDIRAYAESDEAQVIQLWREVFPDNPSWNVPKADIDRKLAVQRDLFLVGALDGEIVATVMAGFDGHRGWVHLVAVAPKHRQRGIGRAMMEEAETKLREIGCTKINLQVRATNQGVVSFYEKLGYAVEERVSMGKRLAADKLTVAAGPVAGQEQSWLPKRQPLMPAAIERLRFAIRTLPDVLSHYSEAESEKRPSLERWTKKEVLGHLIDSASNNHQRFVRGQISSGQIFPGYEQEQWIRIQRYQTALWNDLIELWRAYNIHLLHVAECMSEEGQRAVCRVGAEDEVTLAELFVDYVEHLEHHLRKMLGRWESEAGIR